MAKNKTTTKQKTTTETKTKKGKDIDKDSLDCAGDGRLLLSKMESKELGVDDCAACSQVHTCPNLLCNISLVSRW